MVSNYSALDISLDRKVTITESFIPEFSLSSFFADLGGSLGLWLGVGWCNAAPDQWARAAHLCEQEISYSQLKS